MFIVALLSLVTGVLMLGLCIATIRDDFRKPKWKLHRSLDAIAYAVGFVCIIFTSLYALASALIWI